MYQARKRADHRRGPAGWRAPAVAENNIRIGCKLVRMEHFSLAHDVHGPACGPST